MKLGWEQPRRLARLKELEAEKVSATYPVEFQGTLLDLPIRTVSLEMPKYRLNNGRTEAAQLQYLATHDAAPEDLFSADLESDAAQRAQHEILSTLINEKDLLPYFREHEQTEPLILTHSGFVLNGNRRLCVFRTLLRDEPKLFSHFANIRVVVLPLGDEKDFDRLESRLQREPNVRAEYPWYADAVKYRRRLTEFDEAEVCAMEGVTKDHIIQYISMLELAEQYLIYRGAPSQYALLSERRSGGGDGRYAFEALVKGRGKFKDAEDRELFTYASFAQILAPKGRGYETIPKIAEHFTHIQVDLPALATDGAQEGDIDKFFGPDKKTGSESQLAFAQNAKNADKVREIVEEVVVEREIIKRDTKKQTFVLDQVRRATTFLKEAYNGLSEGTTRNGIAEQLAEAETYIAKLKEWASSKQ